MFSTNKIKKIQKQLTDNLPAFKLLEREDVFNK